MRRSLRLLGGLRSKIIAWTFVPTAIVLVAVALVSILSYRQVTEELVIERDQDVIRLAAQQFASKLSEYSDVLTALARTSDIYDGTPSSKLDALRQASNRLVVFDGGVLALDTFGIVDAVYPERPEIVGQDWSDRSYYREILRGQIQGALQPVYSDIEADGPDGTRVIAVAVPVTGERGEFQGMLAGMFRLGATSVSSFYGDMVRLRISSGNTYLVDSSGDVIYHTEVSQIGSNYSHVEAVARVRDQQVGALRTSDVSGHDIVASFSPVPGTSWGLVTEEFWAVLTKSGRSYQRFLLLLLLAGVVFPTLVVTAGVRKITRPIGQLIQAAQEVAQGRFAQKISANTGDEIEEMARQFNLMSDRLQESYSMLEERVASRTRELAALNDIAATVSRSLDQEETITDALAKTCQIMGVESAGIYLIDEETGLLRLSASRGFSELAVDTGDEMAVGEGFSGRVVATGRPLAVEDIDERPELVLPSVRLAGIRSLASVPLIAQGDILGTLFAASRQRRVFPQNEVDLMASIGQQVGVAVQNAHLYERAESRLVQLQTLYRADEELYRYLRLDRVLQALTDVAVEFLGVDKSAVLVCSDEKPSLVIGAQRGFDTGNGWDLMSPGALEFAMSVAEKGDLFIAEDTASLPETIRDLMIRESVQSCAAVPIIVNDDLFGLFNVNYTSAHRFDDDDQRLIVALAQRVARAIENAQLYEQAQELAAVHERQRLARDLHDAVTQTLFSASLIAEVLPRIWNRNEDQGRERLEELRQLTRGALAEMRTLLLELRPTALTDAELGDLLKQLAEATTGRSRVPIGLDVQDMVDDARGLSPDVKVALYRIAQEALNNISKHSGATEASVSLARDADTITLAISDNGRGFDRGAVPANHLGLGIMRERAEAIGAALDVDSALGQGTRIAVHWRSVSRNDASEDSQGLSPA